MIEIKDFILIDQELQTPEQYEKWRPEDLYDFDEWAKVLVGDDKSEGGSWYQVHICSDIAINRIPESDPIYKTYYWQGVDALINEMELYLSKLIPESTDTPIYEKLSEVWLWEYGKNT